MLKNFFSKFTSKSNPEIPKGYQEGLQILDEYLKVAPTNQNCIDIFKNQWSSIMPEVVNAKTAGYFPAACDDRIDWMIECLGGAKDKTFLELGPLEGLHAWMLEQASAASVISIESNQRAFLKCLITKEVTGMNRTRFLHGDFVEYLLTCKEKFDHVVSCGVLYHMLNPAETIELVSRVSDSIFIWTHYYDEKLIRENEPISRTFPGRSKEITHAGYTHKLYEHEYLEQLSVTTFCGGSNPISYWLDRDGLLGALSAYGFTEQKIGFDTPDAPAGPALCVFAQKPKS